VAQSSDGPKDLRFLGIISLADPVRPDSKEMIEGAKELGIRPIMLTGDNIAIAEEIARQVSIGGKIVKAEELKKLSDQQQGRFVEKCGGFAQIYPEDKHLIVKLLQSNGHVVGMTGDGVNDAPALKQAEMGIAVSTATDVAKSSASVVLTEQGVGVIIDAVRLSRQTYQRMLSWVINKVTKTIQVIGLLTIGFFWTHEVLLSLLGMTLLVFANDFATISLSTDNVKHAISPNVWNIRRITSASLIIGLFLVLEGVVGAYMGVAYFHLNLPQLQTLVLVLLVFTSQLRVLIVRERTHFWSSMPGRDMLISSVATTVAFVALGTFGLIIPAIPFYQVLTMLGFALVFTALLDLPKYMAFRKFGL
jgi:H+-transporting ATPase